MHSDNRMNSALISVIVPVYNAEKTLAACAESILSQAYSPLEVIFVDDGSRDRSLSLCQEIARQDARVRVIHQENAGPAAARNAALTQINGQYVLFVDSDDRLAPDACRRMVDAMAENDLVIGHYYFELGKTSTDHGLLSGTRAIDENEFLLSLMQQPGSFYFSALWNKLYSADIIRRLDLRFDPFFDWGEDFAFNMQYFHAVHNVGLLEKPVYHYVKSIRGTSLLSWLRIPHSCVIKARLYRQFKNLFIAKGLYAKHKSKITRYIYNVTLSD